jgi:hypothetical protein
MTEPAGRGRPAEPSCRRLRSPRFGHLLRVNGLEGGSASLTGKQLMGLWDRLCSLLRSRDVSVEDVSNKARRIMGGRTDGRTGRTGGRTDRQGQLNPIKSSSGFSFEDASDVVHSQQADSVLQADRRLHGMGQVGRTLPNLHSCAMGLDCREKVPMGPIKP